MILLVILTLPLIILFLCTFGPIKRMMWPTFVIFFGLLLLLARCAVFHMSVVRRLTHFHPSISAICQLKLSREQHSSSTYPQQLPTAYSPIIQKAIEQSAGLGLSPEKVPMLSQHQHIDLEAMTTQLSLLVHAIERLVAQNASPLSTSSTSIPLPVLPIHLQPRPDNQMSHVWIDVEQSTLLQPISLAHRAPAARRTH
jgi:hypothetical protein